MARRRKWKAGDRVMINIATFVDGAPEEWRMGTVCMPADRRGFPGTILWDDDGNEMRDVHSPTPRQPMMKVWNNLVPAVDLTTPEGVAAFLAIE